ncbi:hypothetical protein [Duganella sp. BJB1802]|nr:hypothetical protein [Duganella sp. BJB1802]
MRVGDYCAIAGGAVAGTRRNAGLSQRGRLTAQASTIGTAAC